MEEKKLQNMTVAELRRVAKSRGINVPANIRKAELITKLEAKRTEAPAPQPQVKPAAAPTQRRFVRRRTNEVIGGEPPRTEKTAVARIETKSEPAPEREPARSMSTQRRMGARTQPTQSYRAVQPRPAGKAAGDDRLKKTPAGNRPTDNRAQRVKNETEPRQNLRSAEPRRTESVPAQRAQSETESRQQAARQTVRAAEPRRAEFVPVQEPARETAPAPAETRPAASKENSPYTGELGDGEGILEIHQDGYGFLRAENCLPGNHDAYVSAAQIRRFNLRTGDHVKGKTRPQQAENQSDGLIYITEINGMDPERARFRRPFDQLVPVYPDQRLRLAPDGTNDPTLRLIDIIAPIGKGQRGMIVAQPKAGKTTILKKIANAITANAPEAHLIVLLIDERPEEVTDMKRSISGEVIYSTFDEAPENHTRVSEMVLERAQRLVEQGKDVVILLDSITRLARAYNLVIPPTGRSLSGGLDPGALYRPKRFFGAARNIENGGSLTIIATALVDTGSRMDDIIFEEFKGTGNMELHLDRSLSERRIFPAVDVFRSGTRREDLLLTPEELEGAYETRRMLAKGNPQETCEQLISFILKTKNNEEYYQMVKSWMHAFDKNPRNR